ncbi:hypothetical protein Bca4012_072010 [Brassica carinata]|uniref:Uncharacterized protein n=3 Tax=Brassica TaxID=3705 RepID=A0A0D3CEJ2_BRAOL|nr:PREDICTED: uncharacterized protein LOC106343415 [Brassica oleracea var. oleracea]KAG2269891.1 hypothetical protein Bca52824_064446 [Brassica carinata]VDD44008.1 unnamed protein product [Brassica oleracea]
MPPGAKKRKALKKKQQQESIGTSTKDNLHGNDEHGSQDDRESDSTLSSPGSQGNDEFGVTKDPSAEATSSALVVKETAKDISDVTQGLGPKSGNVAPLDPCVKEIAPAVDSVSKVVVFENTETSTHSHLVKQTSDEEKKYPSTGLGKDNGKVATLPGSAAGTCRKIECVGESEAPLSAEEKRLLLPGPQALRTSWLSCCGLFDAMTGSDR